jgi:death-on-curing family protein
MKNMKKEIKIKQQIVLYKNKFEVRLEQETVWLTQEQMGKLFNRNRTVITKHINNVFKEGELSYKSNVHILHIANSDKPVKIYNLDVVISVGYRVKSQEGTQFRIWATNVLRKHLIDGYTINNKRLKVQKDKIQELQEAVDLLSKVALLENVSDEAKGIIQIISEYSRALNILDDFDHHRLGIPKGTKKLKYELTYPEAKNIIEQMKINFSDSYFFGQEKDGSFKSSVSAIYQTFGEKDLYPTIEEKSAHLLYFITKNHSFIDGNKRIAASFFVYFMQRNGILLNKKGDKRIDNNTLVALTLMIASSSPKDKDVMIRVILNLICDK